MAQIVGILLLIGVAVVALKVALVLLLLAGLIFRTRETLGLIMVLGALALLRNYPTASMIVAGAATVLAFMKVGPSKKDSIKLPDKPDS
jgi:hypothetical protein